MKTIRFPDADAERRALDLLIGEFAFTTWDTGDMLVPEAALSALTQAGIPFSVKNG